MALDDMQVASITAGSVVVGGVAAGVALYLLAHKRVHFAVVFPLVFWAASVLVGLSVWVPMYAALRSARTEGAELAATHVLDRVSVRVVADLATSLPLLPSMLLSIPTPGMALALCAGLERCLQAGDVLTMRAAKVVRGGSFARVSVTRHPPYEGPLTTTVVGRTRPSTSAEEFVAFLREHGLVCGPGAAAAYELQAPLLESFADVEAANIASAAAESFPSGGGGGEDFANATAEACAQVFGGAHAGQEMFFLASFTVWPEHTAHHHGYHHNVDDGRSHPQHMLVHTVIAAHPRWLEGALSAEERRMAPTVQSPDAAAAAAAAPAEATAHLHASALEKIRFTADDASVAGGGETELVATLTEPRGRVEISFGSSSGGGQEGPAELAALLHVPSTSSLVVATGSGAVLLRVGGTGRGQPTEEPGGGGATLPSGSPALDVVEHMYSGGGRCVYRRRIDVGGAFLVATLALGNCGCSRGAFDDGYLEVGAFLLIFVAAAAAAGSATLFAHKVLLRPLRSLSVRLASKPGDGKGSGDNGSGGEGGCSSLDELCLLAGSTVSFASATDTTTAAMATATASPPPPPSPQDGNAAASALADSGGPPESSVAARSSSHLTACLSANPLQAWGRSSASDTAAPSIASAASGAAAGAPPPVRVVDHRRRGDLSLDVCDADSPSGHQRPSPASGRTSPDRMTELSSDCSTPSHSTTSVTTPVSVQRSLQKRRVSFVVVNMVGFTKMADDCHDAVFADCHAWFLQTVASCITSLKGVCDAFWGDRVYASYNVAKSLTTHKLKATAALVAIRDALRTGPHCFDTTAAATSGECRTGHLATLLPGAKKLTIVSASLNWCNALERYGRHCGHASLVDENVQRDAHADYDLKMVAAVLFRKVSPSPLAVYDVLGKRELTEEQRVRRASDTEWMYMLNKLDLESPQLSAWNSWAQAVMASQWADADRVHAKARGLDGSSNVYGRFKAAQVARSYTPTEIMFH